MPLRNHEDILVFYKKLPTYNPQMVYGEKSHHRSCGQSVTNRCYGNIKVLPTLYSNEKFPISIIDVEKEHVTGQFFHPTQKPVALLEYLIKTYTNEGETVLDNTMGSGSTGVACIRTKRKFIGIELNDEYFGIAQKRISQEQQQLSLF
jgi:DNA modification methylase